MKILVLAAFYIVHTITTPAQTVSNITASMDNVNGAVNLTYNLSSKSKRIRYKVEVYCSEDKGKTFSDPLIGISGDVGYNIKPGLGKKINWAYFVDIPEFKGKNVVFKIAVKEDIEYKDNMILTLGGPEKFYQSILIPGYGNYHVRNGKGYMIITCLVGGLLGTGTYLHYRAQDYYTDYRNSTTIEMADQNYKKATSLSQTSNILLASGFGIWTIDVGQVIMKGISNRKKQKEILRRRQK